MDNYGTTIIADELGIFKPLVETPREQSWKIIPVHGLSSTGARLAHRLNGFGSLYYFTKVILRKRRLTPHLHQDICLSLEKWHLKDVYEIPRDHFKSTICSEACPIWWALPFTDADESAMRALGYGDEWIRWMRRAHNQDTRTLLVSGNTLNAQKLGKRVNGTYESNDLFRLCYPEVLPGTKETWTDASKFHKRSDGHTPQGEGTYDFLGVGAALQSRHYDRIIQDDLVGKDAIESQAIMEDVIDYHRLLVGAFDSDGGEDNDELIVGNRWSHNDLSSWVRENEPYFRFTTHSAEGGCCVKHPRGKFIFPEEFNLTKLRRWERRLGRYLYTCQFLNAPETPEQVRFKETDLRYFDIKPVSEHDRRAKIFHEVYEGMALPDLMPSMLNIQMVIDPNHAGAAGRCRHSIIVIGYLRNPDRVYLLDYWAKSASYDDLCGMIYKMAKKWHLNRCWLETNAAQKYLKYHLDYRSKVESINLVIDELPSSRGEDAKWIRIDATEPLFKQNIFYVRRNCEDFRNEFVNYYKGTTHTVDILDCIGYAIEVFNSNAPSAMDMAMFMAAAQPVVPQGACGYDG
jgi:hypothetical protein